MIRNYDESVEINHNPIGLIFPTIPIEFHSFMIQDQAKLMCY